MRYIETRTPRGRLAAASFGPLLLPDVRGFGSLALACLSLTLLAACAGAPRVAYDVEAASEGFPKRTPRGQLAVLEPVAIQPVVSDRIVVRASMDRVETLGGAQWVDRLPILVQARLIESFENARLLRGVGRSGILADRSLHSEIRRFDFDAPTREAVVELFVRLNGTGGQVVASRLFSARVPVPSDDQATIAAALNAALKTVLREIVTWTARKV